MYPSNRTVSRDEIIFEVEVTWASECDLEVVVKQTHDFVCLGVKAQFIFQHLKGLLLSFGKPIGGSNDMTECRNYLIHVFHITYIA